MAKVRGFQVLPDGSMKAYIKAGRVQRVKRFPAGTDPLVIEQWRATQRLEIKKTQPARGTLAADIQRFVEGLPEGRRRQDFDGWLSHWASSPLGSKPRARITTKEVADQLEAWRKGTKQRPQGYSGASLNKLRQALLSLWRELDRYDPNRLPCPAKEIPKWAEGTPRKGFFEAPQIAALTKALGPDYADIVTFASFSGWRRSEILNLTWDEVDLPGGVIRLSPERSKNDTGRTLPIVGPLVKVMERRVAEREKHGLQWVFTRCYSKAPRVTYRQVKGFRKAWASACKRAGVEGRTLHDFRRTTVRNLTRSGNPEAVSMAWTGHKTRAVFDRYNIVSESDLKQAGAKLAAHMGHGPLKASLSDAATDAA